MEDDMQGRREGAGERERQKGSESQEKEEREQECEWKGRGVREERTLTQYLIRLIHVQCIFTYTCMHMCL